MSSLVTGDVLFISEPRFIKALLQVTREDIVLFGVHCEGVAPNHQEHRTSFPWEHNFQYIQKTMENLATLYLSLSISLSLL